MGSAIELEHSAVIDNDLFPLALLRAASACVLAVVVESAASSVGEAVDAEPSATVPDSRHTHLFLQPLWRLVRFWFFSTTTLWLQRTG